MSYRGLQPLDPELQASHEKRSRMLGETQTVREATERYGVREKVLSANLHEACCWPVSKTIHRWYIADIEKVLGRCGE